MPEPGDATKIRSYIRVVDGENWAAGISNRHLAAHASRARAEVRVSGRNRGWLGIVHARLKAEREGPRA